MNLHAIWRIFAWTNIVIYALLVYEMWRLWTVPTPADLPRITTFALLMGFEFILVHSAVFMIVFPRKVSVFFLIPVYGVVALMLNSGTDNNVILYLYLGLLFTRLRYLFGGADAEHRSKVLKTSIIAGFIYLFSVAVIALGETSLPEKGLNKVFLTANNYYETLTVHGIFTENPHLPIIMGIVYFSMLIGVELFTSARRFYLDKKNEGVT